MHEHLELFLPPSASENVEVWIQQIMEPFSIHWRDPDYNDANPYAFYDYYKIGGGHAGAHMIGKLDPDRSRSRAIWPDYREQEIERNRLWHTHFPGGGPICPFFQSNAKIESDICLVSELPFNTLTANRLFVAQNRNEDKLGELPQRRNMHNVCSYMLAVELWNGANLQRTDWNGVVADGIERQQAHVRDNYREEYWPYYAIGDDWLVATIDYHH